MNGQVPSGPIADLADGLDVFGADLARWPERRRLAAEEVLKTSVDARRLLAEAQALDAVLSHAPAAQPAATARVRDALMARLAEEAPAAEASASPAATVVALPSRRGVRSAAAPAPRTSPAQRPLWREALVLAAALLIGVFAGTSGVVERSGIAALGATDSADGYDVSVLAFGSDLNDTSEEGNL
jgi:hypothetical protein